MLRFALAIIAVGTISSLGACGAECGADKDCEEVVCADGTKVRSCKEGACYTFSDCPKKTGGW